MDFETYNTIYLVYSGAILSEVTRRDRDNICLIEKSVSFDFRIPHSKNEETDGLTEEEKRSIESEFSEGSIKLSEVLGKSFQTKGKNCIAISKPILFRNVKRETAKRESLGLPEKKQIKYQFNDLFHKGFFHFSELYYAPKIKN